MTIDEAIKELKNFSYLTNSEELQIAEWLEELKDYRDKNKMVVRIDVENVDSVKDKIEELSKYAESQYNKAIDDFVNDLKDYFVIPHDVRVIEMKAQQLKAGGENDNLRR